LKINHLATLLISLNSSRNEFLKLIPGPELGHNHAAGDVASAAGKDLADGRFRRAETVRIPITTGTATQVLNLTPDFEG
jgi:hypothetical protein